MRNDPIVDEIHRIREELSKASGDDLRRITEAARKRQLASANIGAVVTLPPKPVAPAKEGFARTRALPSLTLKLSALRAAAQRHHVRRTSWILG